MKLGKLLLNSLLFTASVFTFTACSDDDGVTPDFLITEGIYILNNGHWGGNDASLYYYDVESKKLSGDIFMQKNGKGIGDLGQDMVIYDSKMYMAVAGSAVIYVMDKTGKILNEIAPKDEAGQPQQPRSVIAYQGDVYVTLFDGYVARINTTSMQIDKKVKVGKNPEQLVAVGNKLYVANSGYGSGNTVSVIDLNSFTELKKIDVILNPISLKTDSQGDVYLISMGNYGDILYTLQRIDTKTDKVEDLGIHAGEMTMCNDKLYLFYCQYGMAKDEIKYMVYDALTEKVITNQFITDGTEKTFTADPYKICSDPATGNIYISTSDYQSDGDMYIFSSKGKLIDKFDTKGINPMGAYMVANE